MEHNEILTEMEMNYETLVGYLKAKYGAAKCDYFTNVMCNTFGNVKNFDELHLFYN